MKEEFEHILFTESYLLGWKVQDGNLTLFLELLLTDAHDKFVQPSRNEIACYKLGLICFHDLDSLVGLKSDLISPTWDEELGEYVDVCEIDSFTLNKSIVNIEADDYDISFGYANLDLEILDSDRFRI